MDDRVVKTPDIQVRECIDHFFSLFRTLKSGYAVVNYYAENDMKFPLRVRRRGRCGEVLWEGLNEERAVAMLHNPFYTGAYIYGRTQVKWMPDGKRRSVPVPQEKWHANIPGHHEAYITQEEFDLNQAVLRENSQQWEEAGKRTGPREGAALIQGICFCGKCGGRMHSIYGYSQATGRLLPKYVCGGTRINGPNGCSESVSAEGIDDAISELEANWNRKLRELDDARRKLDEEAGRNQASSESELAEAIQNISRDFKRIWNAPGLKNDDRKRIIRYLIKDVTIKRTAHHTAVVQICFQGGAVQTLEAPVAKPRYKVIETPKDVIDFLRKEAESHPYTQLTAMLNEQGYSRQRGHPFTPKNVHRIMKDYGIKSMKQRYLDRGWLTLYGMAERVGITPAGLSYQVKHGIFQGDFVVVEDRGTMLFAPPARQP